MVGPAGLEVVLVMEIVVSSTFGPSSIIMESISSSSASFSSETKRGVYTI